MSRIQLIRSRLEQALAPTQLEIIDESHLHVGHVGSQNGAGHFAVRISSPRFAEQSLLACHRLVYSALGDAIGPEIHALRIEVIR